MMYKIVLTPCELGNNAVGYIVCKFQSETIHDMAETRLNYSKPISICSTPLYFSHIYRVWQGSFRPWLSRILSAFLLLDRTSSVAQNQM